MFKLNKIDPFFWRNSIESKFRCKALQGKKVAVISFIVALVSPFLIFSVLLPDLNAQAISPEMEKTAQAIERNLMAPCCWGSVVAEHASPVALEMKEGIRQALLAGKSESEILDMYARQYGERVLTEPKKQGFNWFLWIIPVILILVSLPLSSLVLEKWRHSKLAPKSSEEKSEGSVGTTELDAQEREKYTTLLDKELYE